MTPRQAANLMRLAREHVREGRARLSDLGVFDYLLWVARPPGTRRARASYSTMQANLHIKRANLVAAVARWELLGLITKKKSWVAVVWEGVRRGRQATNVYLFPRAAPEFRRETVFQEGKKASGLQGRKLPAPAPLSVVVEGCLARFAVLAGLTMPARPRPG